MAKVIRDRLAELAGAAMIYLSDVQDRKATQLVMIAVAWAQHQCGWHESILTNVTTILPHFEARWLQVF
eukprot:13419551-Ditylum_brightwellii.AAC.1